MKRHFAMAGIVAIAAVLAFGGFVSAAPRSAVAVALPNLPGGTSSSAAAVNDAGQIVGWATTAAGTQHAVVWDHGVITDLGTLPGGTYSAATGVNDKAQVVGYARIRGPFDVAIHGFLWQNGQMTDLQPLQPSSPRVSSTSSASGINNGSRIVGDSASYDFVTGVLTRHAMMWHRGVITDLGAIAGDPISVASAINEMGQIVGSRGNTAPDLAMHPVAWSRGQITPPARIADERFSSALGLNQHGDVVGQCATATDIFGCVWRGTAVAILLPLPGDAGSVARDINDRGLAVRSSALRAVTWRT